MTPVRRPFSRTSAHSPLPRGMTLVEMLVATTAALILLGIVAQLFSVLGRGVSNNTNVQSLNSQLRGVAQMLRRDLDGITAPTLPPLKPAADAGYLEIIEGPQSDGTIGLYSAEGDCDDVVLFTSRNMSEPFIGRFESLNFESQTAEIAWFCKSSSSQPFLANTPPLTLHTLYRRQLLVASYIGTGQFCASGRANCMPFGTWPGFFDDYDISCRREGGALVPNSLGDLTKRENRFLRDGTSFPYAFPGSTSAGATFSSGSNREGDDIVLTNVIGFDVRVFDPKAPIKTVSSVAVGPGDRGYSVGAATGSTGAYVDLNWDSGLTNAILSTAAFPPAGQTAFQGRGVSMRAGSSPLAVTNPTYDTWSTHYEFDGIDQGNGPGIPAGTIDEGTNGVDDNSDGVVDDAGELETSPPYPAPLRGIEIRIRCIEPSSRQVRQITVRHTFVPQ